MLHADASGAELRDLYGRASIFWHAAGLGEDPERHPDRYEHFGITTVEAMSAGAVPVVIDAAGQAEIVEQGPQRLALRRARRPGRHHTGLIDADGRRAAMAVAARARAHGFGWAAFVDRVRVEVAALGGWRRARRPTR